MVANTLSMCGEGSIYTPCQLVGVWAFYLGRAWHILGFEPETRTILDYNPSPLTVTTATTATTKGILLEELSESITITTTTIPSKDKGKGIMVEEPLKMKKKDQISFDEQEALRLQAEFNKEDRLVTEKAQQVKKANIDWDDIQAKIDADYQLAERLHAQEQQELTIEEKSTLFQQLLEKRRKFFTAKRAEEKRKATLQLSTKSIMVNIFVDMDTELVEGSEVRAEGIKKRYPLTPAIITAMLNKKLQADHWNEMWRIVKIKRLLDDLEVTTAQVRVTAAKHELVFTASLMLLVQKLLLLVLKVNAVGIKVTIAERLQLMEEFMLTEKISKTHQRKNKD
ncbi:hypothetical protein Tco_1577221 [Tanacetum coccineum]